MRRPLSELSTATQQMMAIARAIGFSSRLVIMDEPTSSLDETEVKVLFEVIRQLISEPTRPAPRNVLLVGRDPVGLIPDILYSSDPTAREPRCGNSTGRRSRSRYQARQ